MHHRKYEHQKIDKETEKFEFSVASAFLDWLEE